MLVAGGHDLVAVGGTRIVHELSLCSAIADTVVEHAGGRAVRSVRLRIGHFRQVVPDTLRFCWELRVEDSPLAGCALEIEEVPATIECRECGAATTIEVPVLRCGACDSTSVRLATGEEFVVDSIEVAADASAGTAR